VDLDAVADELYALPLGEFVAVRNARAKEAKAAGDRELSSAIAALAKPTKAGWLTNQLVRRRRGEITPLLELGAGLREATASLSGEQLRELTKQQGRLVHALVQQARQVAAELGESVTDDIADGVDQTLRAALADEALSDQLAQARLTDRLQPAGFGGMGLAPPPTPKRSGRAVLTVVPEPKVSAQQRKQAEKAAAEASRAAAAAAADLEQAQQAEDQASDQVRSATGEVQRLAAALEQAKADHVAAEQAHTASRGRLEKVERAARRAERARDEAAAALAALD
jgi:hypothetical protein